ncbi:MAG TPA: PEP-CTERM sorting domain-containing protein, partial [Rhizomicrobium sp.]|nr:PEP-CTERM sorting domain-containing protein [Rhizomicrobium sp.]
RWRDMRRFWPMLTVCLGLGATALPASADVTYILNCSGTPCPTNTNNYGSVTLHQLGTGTVADPYKVELTVNLIPVMENFAGTGAGFAINWNITGNPNLSTTLQAADYKGDPLPSGAIYNTSNFTIQDNTTSGHTYKASPFGSSWMYAIDYNQNGGNSTNDNYLIFDVTKATGVVINDFIATTDGFFFAVDIFGGPCNPTCVVASNRKLPEPGTWMMIIAGMGALFLLQRRRKSVHTV